MIEILFECSDYLIINKPAGLMTHPDGKSVKPTLSELLLLQYPDLAGVGETQFLYINEDSVAVDRPGIVHRLDTDTSGIMVVARTQESYEHLKGQFSDHKTIEKEYRAFVYGKPREPRGAISTAIGRAGNGDTKWAAGGRAREPKRPALTYYECKHSFTIADGTIYTFVRAMPKTGRTHQIRVHLSSIGCAVVRDAVYSSQANVKTSSLGFRRQALHAFSLSFINLSGQRVAYTAPFPEDFQKILTEYSIVE